jgi:flagellar biosynthetic protein FliS
MSNQRAFSEYHQTSAVGTSGVGQVVALYQTILRDFSRAAAALEQGNIEKRVAEVNHALLVIAELHGVLDFERGGAAAKQLDRFYEVSRAEILKVSVAPSREGFQRLIDLFTPVCQAWSQVSQQLPAVPAREARSKERVRISVPTSSLDAEEGEQMSTLKLEG